MRGCWVAAASASRACASISTGGATQQPRIRRAPLRADLGERDHGIGRHEEAGREARHERRDHTNPDPDAAFHGFTITEALGISPSISGAYIASTRVAGRSKRPELLRRTVYSTVNLPFGTK